MFSLKWFYLKLCLHRSTNGQNCFGWRATSFEFLYFTILTDNLGIVLGLSRPSTVHGIMQSSTKNHEKMKILFPSLRYWRQSHFPWTIVRWSKDCSEVTRTMIKLSRPCVRIHCGKIWVIKLNIWYYVPPGFTWDQVLMARRWLLTDWVLLVTIHIPIGIDDRH